jgi:hypothetical protein
MPVRLSGSTSGYTELSAPAVAGNNSIALPTGNGSAFQILRNGATAGSLEYADKLVLMTANAGGTNPFPSTGGPTVVDFTGIPSWAKQITVMFNAVSTNGTSPVVVRLGAGTIQSTGYNSVGTAISSGTLPSVVANTDSFVIIGNTATAARYGSVTLCLLTGNTWTASGNIYESFGPYQGSVAGNVVVTGPLDRVRITTASGTDTFDAGSINILYE